MSDSICDKAVNVAEMSEDILDSIIGELESATEQLQAVQNGDVSAENADLDVNIMGKTTTVDSPALAILMQNAFQKLPADKAARISAEQEKMAQKIERHTA